MSTQSKNQADRDAILAKLLVVFSNASDRKTLKQMVLEVGGPEAVALIGTLTFEFPEAQ